jgi:tetratricopeptide (TPR) repeat protein
LVDAAPAPGAPHADALAKARAEWADALRLRADYPETQLQMGGAALQARNFVGAVAAFEQAVTLDPQLVDAWSMVVRLHAAMGDAEAARAALARALTANPGDSRLLALQ